MEQIDIFEVIKKKNSKLARRLPRFVIRMFERLVKLEEINYIIQRFSDLPSREFIGSSLEYMGVKYELHGLENIPAQGRLIFASNHPFGGLDGLILAYALGEKLETDTRKVRLIVNDILMNIEPLKPLFVPVNKHGSQGADYARAQRELYESQDAIITFPAGLCSRLIKREITDTAWKKSFVVKAREYDRVIIPTFVAGVNSKLFYRTAWLRQKLGIKVNLEMVLLPREMFLQKNKNIKIYFGKPVDVTIDNKSASEYTEYIRSVVYSMRKK